MAGRVALVTAGAGDIGRAIDVRLAAEGATVVASDLDRAAAALTVRRRRVGPRVGMP